MLKVNVPTKEVCCRFRYCLVYLFNLVTSRTDIHRVLEEKNNQQRCLRVLITTSLLCFNALPISMRSQSTAAVPES
mgnify:CR=1 FL=1